MRALFPHQVQALDYAQSRHAIGLLMEMRLGKSLVAIRWARYRHPRRGRVLVVTPLSVIPSWHDELVREQIPATRIYVVRGTARQRRQLARPAVPGWFLVNYETVLADPQLVQYPWDAIILDESTRIRNPKAKITKLLLRHTGHIPDRAILTGMPNPESHMDFFCQMQFLYGTFLDCTNFWVFRKRYFYADQFGYNWVPRYNTVDRIKRTVHDTCFVRTRAQTAIGGTKIYETRNIPATPEQLRATRTIMRDYAYGDLQTKWATTRTLWLARVAGGFPPNVNDPTVLSNKKIQEVLSLLKTELRGQPVVIWFRFNRELHAVVRALVEHKYRVRAITGATPAEERGMIRRLFQSGQLDCLCLQIKTGKFGLDLSRASTAIYYSNSYEYEERAQSEDRIVHPTTRHPLLLIDLVTEKSADEAIVKELKRKHRSARFLMQAVWSYLGRIWPPRQGPATSAPTPAPVRIRRRKTPR